MTLCIDTNAYSRLMTGDVAVKELLEKADSIIIPTIVLGELYAGFETGTRREENRRALKLFMMKTGATVVAVTEETADRYGLLVKELRKKGKPIPTNDLWIASIALESGAQLLSYDSHFNVISGLRVIG
ncbi:MAG: type II toxin-antitoxin system VapC family toxin [Kiritimatiellae bacterium]|jgi:tRNA(fMet)-specific endonuclease VapC|nr:type II toxin-antitoxin system VapC family toxin [Kiritimatiellia bacterium]